MAKKLIEVEILVPTTYLVEVDADLDITSNNGKKLLLTTLLHQDRANLEVVSIGLDNTSEVLDANEYDISDEIPEEFRYENSNYNRFVRDMLQAGSSVCFENDLDDCYRDRSEMNYIRNYQGRWNYSGPAIVVRRGGTCPNTVVRLRYDSMGLDMIYYPG